MELVDMLLDRMFGSHLRTRRSRPEIEASNEIHEQILINDIN
jgi:hypothetical protein